MDVVAVVPPGERRRETALLLQGGGARAAYQVGVLKAIKEILGNPVDNPFPILCGTSAGAINAAVLATHADNFSAAVDCLETVWREIAPNEVYRTDFTGVARNSIRWLSMFLLGAFRDNRPVSLFDVEPLVRLLTRHIDLSRLDGYIATGHLRALAITASGYSTGQNCTFFQAAPDAAGWRRMQRVGIPTRLTLAHVLASAAIPFAFPAVKLDREFFGDGSMRQMAPVSPALHLGARRLIVVGTARLNQVPTRRVHNDRYPSLAQISGHVMASIFFDMLAVDIERLTRINRTLSLLEARQARDNPMSLRPVDVVVACPTKPFDAFTTRHERSLPWTIRFLLRSIGAMRRSGATLTSYLLFEPGYCKALIEMGYRDSIARSADFEVFFGNTGEPMGDVLVAEQRPTEAPAGLSPPEASR